MTDNELRRELAERLDLLTEDDFIFLSGVTPSTAETWRKRGIEAVAR